MQEGRTFTDFCCKSGSVLLELCLDPFSKDVVEGYLSEEGTILIIEGVAFYYLPYKSDLILAKFFIVNFLEHAVLDCLNIFTEQFLR